MERQSKQPSTGISSTIRELLIPFFVPLILYILTISDNLSVSSDSIDYINTMDNSLASGSVLFHPHHLLSQPVGVLWLAFLRSIGITSDSARIVPLLPAIIGSLTLCVFYLILRNRLGLSRILSLLGTALPAFSFAFWYYSGCVDVYNIPFLFLTLSFYLVTGDKLGAKQSILIGFITALAVIFHQVHILFVPVVVAAFYIRRREPVSFLRRTVSYLAGLVPTVVLPYLLVIFAVKRFTTIDKILDWITMYGHNSAYWHPLSLSTLFKAVTGFSRSIIGYHFIMVIPSFRSLIDRFFANKWLADEYYLVHEMDPRLAIILLGLSVLLTFLVLMFTILRLRNIGKIWTGTQTVIPLVPIWFMIYGSFFFFFEPQNFKFWITQSLCWWLFFIALFAFPKTSKPRTENFKVLGLSLIAILILLVNYMGSIAYTTSRTNDYYYQQAAPLAELSNCGDLIIADRSWVVDDYLNRFTEADILCLTDVYEESEDSGAYILNVENAITQTLESGNRVLVLEEAVNLEVQTIRNYGEEIMDIGEFWDNYRNKWQKVEMELTTIYLIELENQEMN